MTEGVGAHFLGGGCGSDEALDAALYKHGVEGGAFVGKEQGLVLLPTFFFFGLQIVLKQVNEGFVGGYYSFFVAFAQYLYAALLQINFLGFEADEFGKADAGAIEQLDDEFVPQAGKIASPFGMVEDVQNVGFGNIRMEPFFEFRALYACGGVYFNLAGPDEIFVKSIDGYEFSAYGAF